MKRALVVTTIFPPTDALKAMRRILAPEWELIVVGDEKTPRNWYLDGVRYLDLETQAKLASELSDAIPRNHYARKVVGYLSAIRSGAQVIAETDDDNAPYDNFFSDLNQDVLGGRVAGVRWLNVYRYFTSEFIWPRGLPLSMITTDTKPSRTNAHGREARCPVQQFLADGSPDVDAIHRLLFTKDIVFGDGAIVLERGTYCPFNSQNTAWWPPAFALLYLPSYASFRMTDIWRSLIAQVCLHAQGMHLAFYGPTVYHQRHTHNLMSDFEAEVPGYLGNERLLEELIALDLSSAPDDAGRNLRTCYCALVQAGFFPKSELALVDLWLNAVNE